MKYFSAIFTFIILVVFLAPLSIQAAEWGEIREAQLNLNVRAKRTPKSEHVVTLAKGQRVKVDFLKDGWFAIFNLNEKVRNESKAVGYANSKYLLPVKAVSKAQAKVEPVKAESAPVPAVSSGEVKASVASQPPSDDIKLGVDPSRIPVKITSDRMTYDENAKIVSFVGNVIAEHGELTLWADRLSAFFASKDNKSFGADSIERIIADGKVRVKKDNTEGTCGKLTYQVPTQLLRMEDNPLLKDGPNSLTGEVINFYVRENRSEVVGGSGKRVKAIFLTPKKN